MKNYYDLLEVSSKASKEVIDKAYKVLIKKYHPDTHNPDLERRYENYIKEINEAYEVLSSEFLREQYDKELALEKQKKYQNQEEYKKVREIKEKKQYTVKKNREKESENNKKIQTNITDNGIIGLLRVLFRKRKFGERKKKDKEEIRKDMIAMGLTAIIIIVLGLILYFLPFTHAWMDENFIQNPLVQGIIKLFS